MLDLARPRGRFVVCMTVAAIVALPATAAQAAPTEAPTTAAQHVHHGSNGEVDVDVCGDAEPGAAHCLARVRTDDSVKGKKPKDAPQPDVVVGSNGAYDPSYLQSAYNAPSATAGAGQLVAVVDADDNARLEGDLAIYRSTFGLPPCTTANGCFRKVDQRGGNALPPQNQAWGSEESLDVQMVSAMCPLCKILVVEADSSSFTDLGTAVNTAVAMGADVVSNSYGSAEYSGEVQDGDKYYNHPGVAIVASTGDWGYGSQFPAAVPAVTAVGGTSLYQSTNTGTRNAVETAWSAGGSGCSLYEPKPPWQTDTGCIGRTIADIAAVGDPATGVWVYNAGWSVFGGTSVSAPIVAGMYALAGNTPSSSMTMSSTPYGARNALNDVTSGSNGSCAPSYLCNAVATYDGPTGIGTPAGTAALRASAAYTGPPAPTAPTLTARTANASAQLSWSAPTGTSGAVSYAIYRGKTAGGETLLKSALSTLGYTDSGLTNGTAYYYKVVASGTGLVAPLTSNEVSATPATVPGSPQNVSAKTSTTAGVNLTWKPPSSNGGAVVTGYQIFRSIGTATPSLLVTVPCGTTTCAYADTATNSGVSYAYRVAAVNSVGPSKLSNSSSAKAK